MLSRGKLLLKLALEENTEKNDLCFNQQSNNLVTFTNFTSKNDNIQTTDEQISVEEEQVVTNTLNNEIIMYDDELRNELSTFDNFQRFQENFETSGSKTTESEQAVEGIQYGAEENLSGSEKDVDLSDVSTPSNYGEISKANNNPSSSEEEEGEEKKQQGADEEQQEDEVNIIEPEDEPKNKKPRKGHGNPEEWVITKNQRKREEGAAYNGLGENNAGKWKYGIPRAERKISPACNCASSRKKSKIKCNEFTESTRESIFKHFWKLTWYEKKIFVRMLVDVRKPVDTKNKQNDISRRTKTLFFHLKNKGVRIRVCKKMFLGTLGIKQWSVLHWIDERSNANTEDDKEEKIETKNKKRQNEGRQQIRDFFNLLPKVESHYCRSSSTKLYLEPIWRTKTDLFREYENYCIKKEIKSLKYKVFEDVFNELNLSIFLPKKDQCDICIGFNTSNVSQEQYDIHQKKKKEARQQKEQDKVNGKFVYTMDLQSVLLCPVLKASAIYYKTKLAIHNFTIFNLKNKAGYCYLWDESEGSLNANEFASIICHFISTQVPFQANDEVILFSDGCGYQNRNTTLSNALLNLAIQCNITITQKILEKGHTQMECDSMHSTIERRLRNKDIYTPSGYIDACKHARIKPRPYEVQYLRYDFFKNYSESCNFYKSIRPGNKIGDPVTTDIRALRCSPNGTIYYKLRHTDEWQVLPQRKNSTANSSRPDNDIPKQYNAQLKIKKEKWDHLQILKGVLEPEHHNFYDSLPHF